MLKIQRKNITLANGTAPTATTIRVALDAEYVDCLGVAVIENTNGGLSRYDVGLKDDNRTIIDPANATLLKSSSNYKADDRFLRSVPFKAGGKTVSILVETFATTTSELNFDFVFLLKKREDCGQEG